MYPTSIKVKRFIVTETGTYNDQYRRPYESHLTQQAFNEILNNASQAPTITPSLFSGLTSQIVAPSANYESQIMIPEGWSERRFKFMLDVEVTYKTGGIINEIITGYSDTPASTVSLYGTLDPNTVFRINNTIHIRSVVQHTPFGNQTAHQISDCSHVLINDNWNGIHGLNKDFLLRPTDIFSRNITSGVENQLAEQNSFDASTVLMNVAQKSNRNNGVPTNYLSSIVKNYTNAHNQMGVTSDLIGDLDALSTAQQYSRENSAARDPFLETLASLRAGPANNSFTLNELRSIDPEVDQKTVYLKKGPVEISKMHTVGQTQGWGGSDLHTHIANLLSSAVPSIMMGHLIMKIAFVSTNMDLTGAIDTRIVDLNGFAQNVDMAPYARAFVGKFENEVLSDIIKNYQVSIGIQMQIDLIGETWISLTINGETIDYVVPSFSDALMVPVVTSNLNTGAQLASDLKNLMDNIVDFSAGTSPNMMGQYSTGQVEPQLTYRSLI